MLFSLLLLIFIAPLICPYLFISLPQSPGSIQKSFVTWVCWFLKLFGKPHMKVVFAGVHFCQKSWVNFWPWKSDLVDIWNISFAHPTYFRLHQKTYITADGKRRLVSNYLNVYRKGWPITVEMSVIDKHCVKCPYSEFFWSLFSHILTEYGNLSRMRENADQKNCE